MRQFSRETVLAAIAVLAGQHPHLFGPQPVPLKSGIRRDLKTLYPTMPTSFLRALLSVVATHPAYLECCTEGAPRYGFDGFQHGAVSANEAAYAAERLRRIRRREAKLQAAA